MTEETRIRMSEALRGEFRLDEPLAGHTALKVGGPADFFAVPADLDDLRRLMAVVTASGTPFLVIGGGYNLLVRDGGFRGCVISLRNFATMELLADARLKAGAGVINQQFVRFAKEQGLAGVEFLHGIPGTVGGALAMNAGAHGGAVLDRVESMTTLRDGIITDTDRGRLSYAYRRLNLRRGEIVLSAIFSLECGEPAAIEERIAGYIAQRRSSQQVGYPNAGSFFKNPVNGPAWRLIEQAGLRGHTVGGAQVSEIHTNFLVNRGGARAKDFIRLAAEIKDKVFQQTGVVLEEEVRIVGED